jgi:hypothetical protein
MSSLILPVTVFSIVVVELILTVACPCDVVKVKVLPLIDAMVPFAPRRWNWEDCVVSVEDGVVVVVEVVVSGTVDVVCEDADEHATATTDKTAARVTPALI